jgi:multiple antibiotic resistance protein
MNSIDYFNSAKMVPLAFAALFPVVNPVGTAIILLGMTGFLDTQTRKSVAWSISINTFALLTIVSLAGSYILNFFGLTIPIVQAAGGLVLASMGWKMLNQEDDSSSDESSTNANPDANKTSLKNRLFYPFTFPVTVGPGCVAVTLTLSAHARSQHESLAQTGAHQIAVILGIFAVCVLVYFSFVYSEIVARRLGTSGVKVLLRLMAFVLLCLGAEIFWNGASHLLHQAFPHQG